MKGSQRVFIRGREPLPQILVLPSTSEIVQEFSIGSTRAYMDAGTVHQCSPLLAGAAAPSLSDVNRPGYSPVIS
jgi:hypothetical protein